MTATLVIVGRPNVGKSTLFNRLVGRRLALVDDQPGVTRDRREGEGRLYELRFKVVDTAGLEEAFDDSLEARMRAQTEKAVLEADAVLMMFDARAGLTPLDEHFAQWLRRSKAPVVLVANKCEGRAAEPGRLEGFDLGLGEPVPVSAEHGQGLRDLYEAVKPLLDKGGAGTGEEAPPARGKPPRARKVMGKAEGGRFGGAEAPASEESDELSEVVLEERPAGPLQLAIVGRPNVGKSTLVNRLVGEERLLTGPEAGITRDSIALDWSFKGRAVRLVDTAGLRRKARISDKVEKLSVGDSLNSIRFAELVVLVVEAEAPMEKQDLTIARMTIDEGRALVIAINKWDACQDRNGAMKALRDRLERSLPQVKGIPVVPISAIKGDNLDRLMQAIFAAHEVWNRRVSTGELNRWLDYRTGAHPPPMASGRANRLKYITQVKTRPPTFAIFCAYPESLPDSYLRYLENSLREDFDLPGTPIRIHTRKGKNPYADRKK